MKKLHLIFAVCEKYHHTRTVPLYETVCKRATELGYDFTLIGGFDNVFDDIPIIKLTNDDTYESAIDKNLLSVVYHYEKNTPFDFYMICDDDTFINFKNLGDIIDSIDEDALGLYGCVGPINGDGRLHVTGGPGILMNRKTFTVLAETIKEHYIKHSVNSDVSIALNAHKYNETNKYKISFINLEKFLHPHLPLNNFKDLATCHLSGKNIYYSLFDELST